MAISLDQFIAGTATSVSSISVVFSSAVSSGSLLVAHAGMFSNLGNTKFSTITDNVNNAGFTQACFSTMASDTNVTAGIWYKLNLSSGAGASTYRISLNSSGVGSLTVCAMLYTGGPFAAGSTGSSNGTSSSPQGPSLTASSTPVLFAMNAVHNSAGQLFTSTTVGSSVGSGVLRTIVDSSNANQVLAVADSTNSSLTQQDKFSLTTSTRWLSNVVVFTGLGSGGAAATGYVWQLGLTGVM